MATIKDVDNAVTVRFDTIHAVISNTIAIIQKLTNFI